MPYKLIYAFIIVALIGCGQPGALYLPTKSAPVLVKPKPDLKEPKKDNNK